MTIKVALAGAGAFGIKHLDGIRNIADVEVISLVGRERAKTQEIADQYGIAHVSTELADSLRIAEVDAVILCTPTQMHAAQALACLDAATRAASTPATSGCAGASRPASSRSSRWTCRPTSSAAAT